MKAILQTNAIFKYVQYCYSILMVQLPTTQPVSEANNDDVPRCRKVSLGCNELSQCQFIGWLPKLGSSDFALITHRGPFQ